MVYQSPEAIVPATFVVVQPCLDRSLYPDGHFALPGLETTAHQVQEHGHYLVSCPAPVQLYVERAVLQLAFTRFGLDRYRCVMDLDPAHHHQLFEAIKDRRLAAGALYSLGELRYGFKLGDLADELR